MTACQSVTLTDWQAKLLTGFESIDRGVILAPVLGKTIAHYRILKLLARGGMGDVFLAQDLDLPRKVALKFLSRRAEPSRAVRSSFVQEARLACQVNHPYICQIYEAREVDGQVFIAMEYVEGETLHERIKGGQLSVREALRLAVETAQALHAIHAKGVVHRDLKPGNVMITEPDGTECHIKLMDFGLAVRSLPSVEVDSDADTVPDVSPPGSLAGTIAYMAPERFGPADPDTRSDIFSLGVVIYEMLSGVHPFRGATPIETLRTMSRGSVAPPLPDRDGAEPMPQLLRDAVHKMLDEDPDRRYQSAREVFTDLRRLLEDWELPVAGAVAVLPFVDESSGRDQAFLCDGIVEDLIYALEAMEGLRVSSRTSVFRFKNRELSLQDIGQQLKVGAIVEGSLRRENDRLRIMVRLMDVSRRPEHTLWSSRYERRMRDVFAIQDDISQAVVQGLKPVLEARGEFAPLVQAGTGSVRAYELYLKARFFWNERTESGLRRSVEHFRDAIQADPDYARAHAGLADAYTTLAIYGVEAPVDLMPSAKSEAESALTLLERRTQRSGPPQEADRELAWALAARGCVRSTFDWDWEGAEADFKKAIELWPANEHARHWYATRCLLPQGRFADARFHLGFAREFDRDHNLIINTSVGLPDYFERRYDQAIEIYQKTLDLDENFGMARYFMGLAYAGKRMYGEALAELERALSLNRESPEIVSAMACVCAAAGGGGETSRAREMLEELKRRSAERYVSAALIAQAEGALGLTEAALDSLEKAHRMRSADLVWLRLRPTFDPIRAHPRFEALCAEVFASSRDHPESATAAG